MNFLVLLYEYVGIVKMYFNVIGILFMFFFVLDFIWLIIYLMIEDNILIEFICFLFILFKFFGI